VCWTCADVKKKHRKAQLAVFALGPKRKSELFQRAGKVLRKLEVALVTEGTLGLWADKQAASAVPVAKRLIDETPRRRAS
jgi:hypothetical protein